VPNLLKKNFLRMTFDIHHALWHNQLSQYHQLISSNFMNEHPTRIGLLFPTSIELQPFSDLIPELTLLKSTPWEIYGAQINRLSLTVVVSYIGPANAAAATEHLITYRPELILHGGSAGAMNPDLMPGDVVIGASYKILCSKPILKVRRKLLLSNKGVRYLREGAAVHVEQLDAPSSLIELAKSAAEIVAEKHPSWTAGGWPANVARRAPVCSAGTLGSQDGWTKDRNELDYIRNEFGVETEDMESAYVAQIAAKHDVPFLAVRAVSNNEYTGTLDKSEIFPAVTAAATRSAEVLAAICRRLS
jgi:adenosylhomocysteine nucleosidase